MKTAVFSDIHGNIDALEAMLCRLEHAGVEQYFFCGDILGYFPWQQKVIERLRQLPRLYAVMGNHDFNYISTPDRSPERISYAAKYGKSYLKQLQAEERKYLESLPVSIELYQEGKRILIVHGSVEQPLDGRVYADTKTDESVYGRYDMVISGHTHYRMERKVKDTVLLNPGSLGQPRDHKGCSYCLIDTGKEGAVFQNVCIDQKKLVQKLVLGGENRNLIKYLQSRMEVVM